MHAGNAASASPVFSEAGDWHLAEIVEPESWLPVPRGLNEGQIGEWGRDVIATLESAWAEQWDEEAAYPIALMLHAVAGTRQAGDGPMYLCWPLPVPMCMTITVTVMDPGGLPEWVVDGELRYYEAKGLGPGFHCLSERRGGASQAPTDLVSTAFVFDDGDSSVVIATDLVPPTVAALVNADLQRFVQSLVIVRPDGRSFRGAPSRRLLTNDRDVWEFDGL